MRHLRTFGIFVGASFLAIGPLADASTCTGNCGSVAPNGDVGAPPGGGTLYYVSTNGGVSGAGQISGVGGTDGSELIAPFSANTGDVLKFDFDYITSDGTGSFPDYGFAELLDGDGNHVAWLFTARTVVSPGNTSPGFGLPTNDSTLDPTTSPINPGLTNFSVLGGSSGECYMGLGNGCGSTGYIQSLFTIDTAGDYQVRFGVSNFGDTNLDSALAFAGLQIGDISIPIDTGAAPEPATWAMMICGFGLAGFALRRRRKPGLGTQLA